MLWWERLTYRILSIVRQLIQLLAITIVVVVGGCNLWIYQASKNYIYTDPEQVKPATALILALGGTNPPSHRHHLLLERLKSGWTLWDTAKADTLLLSGKDWEVKEMATIFKEWQVPESALLSDQRSVRTLDSVIRAKQVYKKKKLVFVSNKFHLYRAVWLARQHGIEAYGFVQPHPDAPNSYPLLIREVFARVLAVWDITTHTRVTNLKP